MGDCGDDNGGGNSAGCFQRGGGFDTAGEVDSGGDWGCNAAETDGNDFHYGKYENLRDFYAEME